MKLGMKYTFVIKSTFQKNQQGWHIHKSKALKGSTNEQQNCMYLSCQCRLFGLNHKDALHVKFYFVVTGILIKNIRWIE